MHTHQSGPLDIQRVNEIKAAAVTLNESIDHLTNLTRKPGPYLGTCKILFQQAYIKMRDLADQFSVDL